MCDNCPWTTDPPFPPPLLQVAKFIPRGVVLQYLGAQREIYIESPAAAALSQYMPSPKASESSRVVKSPMTGQLVEVRRVFMCSLRLLL